MCLQKRVLSREDIKDTGIEMFHRKGRIIKVVDFSSTLDKQYEVRRLVCYLQGQEIDFILISGDEKESFTKQKPLRITGDSNDWLEFFVKDSLLRTEEVLVITDACSPF